MGGGKRPVDGVCRVCFGVGSWACSQGEEIPNQVEEGPLSWLPRGRG
jgi:hypothetical protein